MKIIATILILFVVLQSQAQQTYQLKDYYSQEVIPFAKIYPSSGMPFLADLDGFFTVVDNIIEIQIKAGGYRDTTLNRIDLFEPIIYLRPNFQQLQEVVALAGENPAHRIINKAIENRKVNNPMENDAFRYTSYSKFIFDMNKGALDQIPDSTTDSTLIKIRQFFTQQHLFLMESASMRTFMPPSRDKEEIIAYKVSGFKDPAFSTFANELQSFSFYENQFDLLGKTYLNPIAFGSTKRYLFVLEDTTINQLDTTFTIFYRPKRGKNFNGMTGRLYINTNGYALEKVTASPYEDTTGTKVQIIQEYAFVNNKKWFPVKLSTEIKMTSVSLTPKLADSYIQGKGSTYVEKIEFNPPGINARDFDNITISTKEDAGEIDSTSWRDMRKYELDKRDHRTYNMIDSLATEYKFDKKLNLMKSLMEGKIPMGYFNIDLARLLNFNLYEGYRFGLGLETSKKLMKPVVIGGYFGYGTRDMEWKYGAYSTVHFSRKKGIRLDLNYQQDLIERGGVQFIKESFSLQSSALYRNLFLLNMDKQRLAQATLSGYVRGNMRWVIGSNYQRVELTRNYAYVPSLDSITRFDQAETYLEFHWNIGEKVMLLGDQRVAKGTKQPRIKLKYSNGWSGIYSSMYNYQRLNLEVNQTIPIRGSGTFSWTVTAGKTFGDVPLTFQQVAIGTGRSWNLTVPSTFETALPSEFFHNEQAALFLRYQFNAFKTKAKWNEPQFGFHHAMGYGKAPRMNEHTLAFSAMDKGFVESGIILNNVLVSGTTGFGIACFTRYGYYASTDWKKNIVPKISLNFVF